jgi:hypothetical protein
VLARAVGWSLLIIMAALTPVVSDGPERTILLVVPPSALALGLLAFLVAIADEGAYILVVVDVAPKI